MSKNVQVFYTKHARLYDGMSRLLGHQQSMKNFFAENVELKPGMKILDAGCGSGALTKALIEITKEKEVPNISFYGFDFTPAMLKLFKNSIKNEPSPRVSLRQADVLKLPSQLPSSWKNFDLIVSAGMLEYVKKEEAQKALENLSHVLKKNGKIMIFISRRSWLNRILIQWHWKAHLYRKSELEQLISTSGFHIKCIKKLRLWAYALVACKSS